MRYNYVYTYHNHNISTVNIYTVYRPIYLRYITVHNYTYRWLEAQKLFVFRRKHFLSKFNLKNFSKFCHL